jgi:hypothetical protein
MQSPSERDRQTNKFNQPAICTTSHTQKHKIKTKQYFCEQRLEIYGGWGASFDTHRKPAVNFIPCSVHFVL